MRRLKQNASMAHVPVIMLTALDDERDTTLLEAALHHTSRISLGHNQNSLDIRFTNLSLNGSDGTLYQTWLEGQEHSWGKATTRNAAIYTYLPPGQYVFHVRAYNGEAWGPDTTLAIRVMQPWYNRWWMWVLYVAAAAALLIYIYHGARQRLRLRQQMRLDKELTEFRLQFFTHITHEFRTPLAIIQSGVYNLLDPQTKAIQKTSLQTIQRGTRRMLRLVNQLMEFRRVSTTGKRLRVGEGDVIVFLRDVWQDLWPVADQKHTDYGFTPFERHYAMLFDRDALETIAYNLLSNALKYTPEGGRVQMRVTHTDDASLLITVEDNGPGVPPEREGDLFKPFMKGYASAGGMGIGLYNARQLALSHHGTLTYERVGEQGGSRFTLTLPTADEAYTADELTGVTAIETPADAADRHAEDIILSASQPSLNEQTVAIIEDDTDMMQQMRETVGYYFKTQCYTNGRDGYEGILASTPKLVLCDLMLPDMDGYEIVRRLKQNASMARVPVIMLTALDDEEHQIKGYQAGADDYMVKPCNHRLLIARMIQLMKWAEDGADKDSVESGHEPVSQPQGAAAPAGSNEPDDAKGSNGSNETKGNAGSATLFTSRADKLFREKVERLAGEGVGDPLFSVDVLAERMHMGRSSFYGRVKEIFGTTPNKYLLSLRMERAARLLVDEGMNVGEASRAVGFQDPSHFNRCFKAYYGVVPSKYKG